MTREVYYHLYSSFCRVCYCYLFRTSRPLLDAPSSNVMKLGRKVEMDGKAMISISPMVRGTRNRSMPLTIVPIETSSPTSPFTTKKFVATGGATIPTMQRAVMSTPNQIGS